MERIKGFGSLSKKGVVHILENQANGFVTICGKKLVNPDEKLNITHVDCGNCQRLPQYNDLIKEYSGKNPGTSKVVITDNGDVFDFSELKLNSPDEKKNVAELRSNFINKLHILQGAFTAEKADNDNFNIVHQLSDHIFYGNLPEKYVAPCLLMLNQIADEWTGRGTPNKKWLESINTAFSAGYCFAENSIDSKSEDNSKIIQLEKKVESLETEKQDFYREIQMKNLLIDEVESKLKEKNDFLENAAENLLVNRDNEIEKLHVNLTETKVKLDLAKDYALEKADFAIKLAKQAEELRAEIEKLRIANFDLKADINLMKKQSEADNDIIRAKNELIRKFRETKKSSKESPKNPDNEVKTSPKKIKKIDLSKF